MPEPIKPKQPIGGAVPDFTLSQLGGQSRTLQSFMEGKRGAVVLFWSGVCSHCIRYDGYLNEFSHRHPEIALVGVASRHGETASQLQTTMAQRKLQFSILHDPKGSVAQQYFAEQTPRAYLIDPSRTLLYRG